MPGHCLQQEPGGQARRRSGWTSVSGPFCDLRDRSPGPEDVRTGARFTGKLLAWRKKPLRRVAGSGNFSGLPTCWLGHKLPEVHPLGPSHCSIHPDMPT